MRFEINIDYPLEKMEASRKRMESWLKFKYIDRVPVAFCVVPRYFTPIFKIPYKEIFKDVETQYYWLLQFAKYNMENIPSDAFCSPAISILPYFDNVVDADAMGAQIVWPENETLHAIPYIKTIEQMEAFEIPPVNSGLWGRTIEWWLKMKDFAAQTRVTFAGHEGHIEMGLLGISGIGPHMIAIDLVGTDFYWWILEYPQACHRFLNKITQALIKFDKHCRTIDKRQRTDVSLAEDSSQIMSAQQFVEFTVPYDRMLYESLPDIPNTRRGMHMCGKSQHLHKALVEELKIDAFNVFGYLVPPAVAAENMGGKVALFGNINPMLIHKGSKEQIKQACWEAIDVMGPYGGFMLGDGANVCPGTPLENLAAFVETAEEYGLGGGKLPHD
ncbi:MAG: hypothetical protein A2Y10_03545 [Planctomycetes bacterium GWF2_41_51]|nr:MAG: hypothetical protein A2Y10_03545 [Planctomycetes bacterium GWF2_41_51]HBG28945.1 hypothetical protein [Phycisphaerales bacterium]